MFPELPDASMDTLNPIVFSPNFHLQIRPKQISKIMAERACAVNGEGRKVLS
jgi:hypothetical protein